MVKFKNNFIKFRVFEKNLDEYFFRKHMIVTVSFKENVWKTFEFGVKFFWKF